jgi:hypothetical protein
MRDLVFDTVVTTASAIVPYDESGRVAADLDSLTWDNVYAHIVSGNKYTEISLRNIGPLIEL